MSAGERTVKSTELADGSTFLYATGRRVEMQAAGGIEHSGKSPWKRNPLGNASSPRSCRVSRIIEGDRGETFGDTRGVYIIASVSLVRELGIGGRIFGSTVISTSFSRILTDLSMGTNLQPVYIMLGCPLPKLTNID